MTWCKAPADLKLDPDCIDIWRSRIDLGKDQITKYLLNLSQAEKNRAEKFTFPEKFEEYVVTRGLLRKALSHVLVQAADSFSFQYTAENKPFLDSTFNGRPVTFNVSHSHGQALVALSLDRNIGIDIEKIRPEAEYAKLAKRFFSSAEYEALMSYEGDPLRAFFGTWTRKEAFVKAVGKGIAFGLGEFDVNVDPDERACLLATRWDPKDVSNWHLDKIETDDEYMATVVADGSRFALRLWQGDEDAEVYRQC